MSAFPYTRTHQPVKLGHHWLSPTAPPGMALAVCLCGWATVEPRLDRAVTELRQHAAAKAATIAQETP